MKLMKPMYAYLTVFLFLSIGVIYAQNDKKGFGVGDVAADFTLKNIDGKMISTKDYKDAKGIVVIFTCNTCPYAKLYENRIIAIHNKYAAQGYPVIAINPNDPTIAEGDSFDEMVKRAKEKGFTFPYVFDQTQEVASAYGATRTPHVYILKKESDLLKVAYIGAIDDNYKNEDDVKVRYVENALDELLGQKSVSETFTKAIGCTIKWKQKS